MDILKTFSSLFSQKGQSVLGIDIGASAIKVVQIKKKKGRAVLETYGELAVGPYGGTDIGRATTLSLEKTAEALTDILRESKTTTRECGMALPLSSSLITFINVPSTDQKHIGEIIAIEARKYIPVPVTEVLLDWSVIPKEDEIADTIVDSKPAAAITEKPPTNAENLKNASEVLVVAIHNESIANYQAITAKAGLHSSFFEIEIFSALRAVLEQGIQAQMVVDMGAASTKLYIIERGVLRASHIINRGSQDITLAISKSLSIPVPEAEKMKRVFGLTGGPEHKELTDIISITLDYIFYEANRVILGYQKKYNKNISKIILTGGGVLLRGFTELAEQSFQNQVIYADPFSKLETPAFLAEQFAEAGPEFAVAIGAALRKLSEIQ